MTFRDRLGWLPCDAIAAAFGAGWIVGVVWATFWRIGLHDLMVALWR